MRPTVAGSRRGALWRGISIGVAAIERNAAAISASAGRPIAS
jgi:hypothetical protein